ncbi:MAG: STAS domain-containing protein [Bacteroidota bacterium]
MTTTFTPSVHDDIAILEISGPLLGGEETDALREAFQDLIDKKRSKLVVDLCSVRFINSMAIGVFMATYASYVRRGWKIKICNLSKEVNVIFAVTKMNQVYDIHDSRAKALAAF